MSGSITKTNRQDIYNYLSDNSTDKNIGPNTVEGSQLKKSNLNVRIFQMLKKMLISNY